MPEPIARKSFLEKLGLGIASFFTLPVISSSGTRKNEMIEKPVISQLREMGFQWETADPFLFCVHHEDFFPSGNSEMAPDPSHLNGRHLGDDFIIKDGFRMYHGRKVPGFPGHPHRGFETITIVRKGLVDHADSLGAAGRYGNGDVQWMTAGKGVQHSEMFPLLNSDRDNPLELFQIWLNLPASRKMSEPHFRMLWSEQIPRHQHRDASGKLTEAEVIAGSLGSDKGAGCPPDSWAADSANEVAIFNIRMEPGAEFVLPAAPPGINRKLYYYAGSGLQAANQVIPSYHSFKVLSEVSLSLKNGEDEARILLLQGRPIAEPVIQYGPFVMNTKEEIHQAFQDYHQTQFGGWPWPEQGQVHERSSGRFALHADGRKEVKG